METIATLTMNPALDVSSQAPVIEATHKIRCEKPRYDAGGGGINVTRAITKLGGESEAYFPSGGHTGQWLQTILQEEGITSRTFPIQGTVRESFTVAETSSGKQYRFNMPGPSLLEAEWRQCLEVITNCKQPYAYWVLSGSLPPGVPDDFFGKIVEMLRACNTRVVIDTSGDSLKQALPYKPFLIKPNQRELEELVGHKLSTKDDLLQAAKSIIEADQAEMVAVSLGEAGMLQVSRDSHEWITAPKATIVSAVGAGDSSVAGIVLGLASGMGVQDAFRYGVAAGTAAVLTPGTELCRKTDTDRLFEEICRTQAHQPMPS